MKKALLYTLGCKLNQAESVLAAEKLAVEGYQILKSNQESKADLIFINTCAVTARAAAKSRHAVSKMARENSQAEIVVAGCLAQNDPRGLGEMPGVSRVIGTATQWMDSYLVTESKGAVRTAPLPFPRIPFLHRVRPLLKIQDGCDQNCTYCIIPALRGRLRSEPLSKLISNAAELVSAGASEIVLTGVRIGAWGIDSGEGNLCTLLNALLKINENYRIRLGSIEPWELDEELLDLVAHNPRICSHLHIPLQHTDPDVIARMGRPPIEKSLRVLAEFGREFPDVGIGCDLISGFPGETAEVFQTHYNTLLNLPLAYLHIFPFSPRPNTPAQHWRTTADFPEMNRRIELLRNSNRQMHRRFQARQIGRTAMFITDSPKPGAKWTTAVSDNYLRIKLPATEEMGTPHEIKITPQNLINYPFE